MTTQTNPHNDITAIQLAARRLFAQQGDAVTLTDIAAAAGLPLDTVLTFYPNKDALLRDLMHAWMAEDDTAAPVAPPEAAPALPRVTTVPGSRRVEENRTLAANLSGFGVLINPPTIPKDGGGAPLNETVASAIRTLGANRMRSFLTMLGIIIGVSAVISLIAVGNAFTGFLTGQLTASGTTTVFISPADQRVNGIATGKKDPSLTVGDANALAALPNPPADAVSPVISRPGTATGAGNNLAVTITGAWETYPLFTGITFSQGAMFIHADVQQSAPVVVIGSTVASTLFWIADPLAQNIQVNGISLRVIGVMKPVGALGTNDTAVIVPISTALNKVVGQQASVVDGTPIVDQILLHAPTIADLTPAADAATAVLDKRHPLGPDGERDFDVLTVASQLQTLQTVLGVLQIFLATVASISLLVGGSAS